VAIHLDCTLIQIKLFTNEIIWFNRFSLTHSFSKKYFDNKFEKEQITNCSFNNFEIAEIESLTNLIQQNPALQGFAITIPHKQKILPFLHYRSHDVSQMLACNCVKIIDGKLYGYNTDVIGFENHLVSC
jgi:shikimate dehydrogenase